MARAGDTDMVAKRRGAFGTLHICSVLDQVLLMPSSCVLGKAVYQDIFLSFNCKVV